MSLGVKVFFFYYYVRPTILIQILDLPQLIPHFGSLLTDGLVAAIRLIIILILSTWAWARTFHLKPLFTFYLSFRAKLAFVHRKEEIRARNQAVRYYNTQGFDQN